MTTATERDAILSECGRYRYRLMRSWGGMFDGPRIVNFIMLNPSTADATADDPTVRRCVGFAKGWGFTGMVVTNLYAYRATDPAELWRADDPIGPENDWHLLDGATRHGDHEVGLVVCAWGSHGIRDARGLAVAMRLGKYGIKTHCLALTKGREPAHPLFLKADLRPMRFDPGDVKGV